MGWLYWWEGGDGGGRGGVVGLGLAGGARTRKAESGKLISRLSEGRRSNSSDSNSCLVGDGGLATCLL